MFAQQEIAMHCCTVSRTVQPAQNLFDFQASTVHSRHFATLSDLWAVGVFADAFTWRWMSNGHVITSLATAPLQQPSFVPVFESGINSYTQTCRYVSYQCIRTKCL